MSSRSAHHSITGLHYQFDKSILSILNAKRSEQITLEGIEDIDLSKKYIQCKYHSSQKYYRSSIKSPILAFLKHYSSSERDRKYTLYAHFKDFSGFKQIDLSELKQILGNDLRKLNLTDSELDGFLSNNFFFERGDHYDVQLTKVITRLEQCLKCCTHDASEYYYKNALHEVIRLSRQSQQSDRVTTRLEFLEVINRKRELYSIWLCQLSSQKNYVQYVQERLKRLAALKHDFHKILYVDKILIDRMGIANFNVLCDSLLSKFFSMGKALRNALPMTLVLDVSLEDVASLKAELLRKGVPVNDGYEHISFQPWYFNRNPIINLKQAGGRPNDIIDKSSYYFRIITRATYDQHFDRIEAPDTFVSTGTVRDCPRIHRDCHRHVHLHSPEFDSSSLLLEVFS